MFSLVIHGQRNEIAAYVLPVEELINLTTAGKEPMMLISASKDEDGEIGWHINENEVDEDLLEEACLQLLNQLIQRTQAVISNTNAA
jgi:DNA-directed RNA polymerase specialized sigma subunit